jgi:hypothetical protein
VQLVVCCSVDPCQQHVQLVVYFSVDPCQQRVQLVVYFSVVVDETPTSQCQGFATIARSTVHATATEGRATVL